MNTFYLVAFILAIASLVQGSLVGFCVGMLFAFSGVICEKFK